MAGEATDSSLLASTYTWTTVALFIFLGLIYWKGKDAIKSGLNSRIDRIREELEEAERLKEEALATLQDYQRKQREALDQAELILASARSEVDHMKADAEAKLEESLKRREAQAMDKIAQAEARAVQEVRDLAIEQAMQASTTILNSKLEGEGGDKMIDKAITGLKGQLN